MSHINIDKKRIWKKFVKGIKEFEMIEKGDKVAIGVSGGKDSLILVYLFNQLIKDRSLDFTFTAIMLNPGFDQNSVDAVENQFKELGIDYNIFNVNIWDVIFGERNEKNPCSLCSKMRRGILYKKAEELGCNKLALGHHNDDIIETVLINMFYSGSIKTMLPKIKSTQGKFDLIRPLVYVKEDDIIACSENNNFPIMSDDGCEFKEMKYDSKRLEIKEMLKNLESRNNLVKKNIFASLSNVKLKYLLGYDEV